MTDAQEAGTVCVPTQIGIFDRYAGSKVNIELHIKFTTQFGENTYTGRRQIGT